MRVPFKPLLAGATWTSTPRIQALRSRTGRSMIQLWSDAASTVPYLGSQRTFSLRWRFLSTDRPGPSSMYVVRPPLMLAHLNCSIWRDSRTPMIRPTSLFKFVGLYSCNESNNAIQMEIRTFAKRWSAQHAPRPECLANSGRITCGSCPSCGMATHRNYDSPSFSGGHNRAVRSMRG